VAYVIIVEFRAKPDQVEAFAALIERHAYNSRREDGCLTFDVSQDLGDPARFVFYEPIETRPRTGCTPGGPATGISIAGAGAARAGPGRALPHQRQVLTRRRYLSE